MRPSSFEKTSRTSYASFSGSVASGQCAAIVPSSRRATDGTSAAVRNQFVPDAAVRGSVQPDAERSANRSVARESPVLLSVSMSTQLTTARSADAVSCGMRLSSAAESVSGVIANEESSMPGARAHAVNSAARTAAQRCNRVIGSSRSGSPAPCAERPDESGYRLRRRAARPGDVT